MNRSRIVAKHAMQDTDPAPTPPDPPADEPMLICPRCDERLISRKCKLICERCGYYMSCADYY